MNVINVAEVLYVLYSKQLSARFNANKVGIISASEGDYVISQKMDDIPNSRAQLLNIKNTTWVEFPLYNILILEST